MFLKINNIEFDEIIITFTDQNGRPLEIEDKVTLTLLINKQAKMTDYSIEPRTRNKLFCNGYGLDMYFAKKFASKYRKQLLDTGIDALKITSKKVFHKAAEATGEFIGNKIADKIVKTNENSRNVKEIIIPPQEKKKNIK